MVRRFLAAQKAPVEKFTGYGFLDAPGQHQFQKLSFVERPIAFFPLLVGVRISDVGASSGMCTYSMPQTAFVKYLRSSFLVNPASCETLFRRTSTNRLTPALFSR